MNPSRIRQATQQDTKHNAASTNYRPKQNMRVYFKLGPTLRHKIKNSQLFLLCTSAPYRLPSPIRRKNSETFARIATERRSPRMAEVDSGWRSGNKERLPLEAPAGSSLLGGDRGREREIKLAPQPVRRPHRRPIGTRCTPRRVTSTKQKKRSKKSGSCQRHPVPLYAQSPVWNVT